MSSDDLLDQFRQRVAEHGYTMVSVGDTQAWTYTIGLVTSYGQPEFVVTGLSPGSASGLITELASRVSAGERFDASSPETMVGPLPVRFAAVHPAQWTHGRFNMWVNFYGEAGEFPEPSAVQLLWPNENLVFPPDANFCHEHPGCQPLLSVEPKGNVNRQPNRSERRRQRRR